MISWRERPNGTAISACSKRDARAAVAAEVARLTPTVKARGQLNMDDTRSLRDFMRRTPACVARVLSYFGQELMPLDERLWAVPLHGLLA